MFNRDSAEDDAQNFHFSHPGKAEGRIRAIAPRTKPHSFRLGLIQFGTRALLVDRDYIKEANKRVIILNKGGSVIGILPDFKLSTLCAWEEKASDATTKSYLARESLYAQDVEKGERASPCLTPRINIIGLERQPFKIIRILAPK